MNFDKMLGVVVGAVKMIMRKVGSSVHIDKHLLSHLLHLAIDCSGKSDRYCSSHSYHDLFLYSTWQTECYSRLKEEATKQ